MLLTPPCSIALKQLLPQWEIACLDTIDSTSRYLKTIIQSVGFATAEALLVTARHQTAGKGRRSKCWVTARDQAVLFSCAIPWRQQQQQLGLSGLAVATYLCQQLLQQQVPVKVKWPNDILFQQYKIAGILVEFQQSYLIIGVGLNLQSPPLITGRKHFPSAGLLTLQPQLQVNWDSNAFIGNLCQKIYHIEADIKLQQQHLIEQFQQNHILTNRRIQITVSHNSISQRITGVCQGVDNHGRLKLLPDNSQQLSYFHQAENIYILD